MPGAASSEAAIRALLDRALADIPGENADAALRRTVERRAQAALERARDAGLCRGFHVRCDDELNPPGEEGLVVEVVFQPPAPRAQAVTVRMRRL